MTAPPPAPDAAAPMPAGSLACLIAFTLAAALALGYVGLFGVNCPIADDWDLVETSLTWHERGLDMASLVAPHNEHRIVLPRLFIHSVLAITGGNFKAVLLTNAALAAATAGLLLWFIRRWPLDRMTLGCLAFAVALFVSDWCQWQNLLWSFQTPWFLLPLILVATAAAVTRVGSPWPAVVAAVAGTMAAAACMANGLFVGWALVPAVALRLAGEPVPTARAAAGLFGGCLLVTTVVGGRLLAGGHSPPGGGLQAVLDAPLEAVCSGLAILGSPLDAHKSFFGRKWVAALAGAVSLAVGLGAAAVAVGRRPLQRDLGVGFALMIYGLVSAAAVVAGRLGMLTANPIESRYLSFGIAWDVGTLLTIALAIPPAASPSAAVWRLASRACSLACIVAILVALPLFFRHGRNMRREILEHQAIYRRAGEPDGRQPLEKISSHYGADRLSSALERMQRAGILHPDLAP